MPRSMETPLSRTAAARISIAEERRLVNCFLAHPDAEPDSDWESELEEQADKYSDGSNYWEAIKNEIHDLLRQNDFQERYCLETLRQDDRAALTAILNLMTRAAKIAARREAIYDAHHDACDDAGSRIEDIVSERGDLLMSASERARRSCEARLARLTSVLVGGAD